MLDLKFDGSGLICIINFLTEFANAIDDLKIHQQVHQSSSGNELPLAMSTPTNRGRTVSTSLKSAALLLKKYTVSAAIESALEDIMELRQTTSENEECF